MSEADVPHEIEEMDASKTEPPVLETAETQPPEPPVVTVEKKGQVRFEISRKKIRSTDPADGVDIAMEESGAASQKPITVGAVMLDTVSKIPDHVAMCYESDGVWNDITYTQYYNQCVAAAKSFLKLGLQAFEAVAILGFNSPECHISALGTIFAGGLTCGIYATSSAEICKFIAKDCKVNIAVVENQIQLDKFLKIRDDLPDLKAIVQYKGKVAESYANVYDWEQFLELGADKETSEIESAMENQKPNQCASLVYTSGTTGNPKGVMLSHDNITWTAKMLMKTYEQIQFGAEHIIGYLPLSHIAAQMADIYLAVTLGATVHFAQPDALKGSLGTTLKEVQPTIFFGVPRVYEKIMERMKEIGSTITGFKRTLSQWAKKKGLQGNLGLQKGHSLPWGWTAANLLVFKRVREALGFQQCKIFVVGAAPTRMETYEYFMSINIPLMNLYGMSESSGPHSLNLFSPGRWSVGSAGKNLDGVRTKLDQPDEDGEGEICFYGRNVFMGYLRDEGKTTETIDDEGWLHSGDIGKFDENGFLHVTGRIKELIITSGGENIPPIIIEDAILKEIPFLSNVMVVGDKRKFLSCLMTLKCEMDLDTGEPTDTLAPLAKTLIENLGSQCSTVSGIIDSKDRAVFTAISEGLERANQRAVSQAQKVQKWTLLDADFSVPGGEFGPTMKVRRFFVQKKYAATIDAMYDV